MYTPPPLLPIFRSDAQARILAWLLLEPTREQPIKSLAAVAGVAQPNALREVNRLIEAGLLEERRAGNTRLVRANVHSQYYEALVALLSPSFGPSAVIPAVVADLPGVEQVIIFGSWAERYLGVPGHPPNDVDVLLVGAPSRRDIRAANRELEERLQMPVQVLAVTPAEWESQASGFVQTVRKRPHVVVVDRRTPE